MKSANHTLPAVVLSSLIAILVLQAGCGNTGKYSGGGTIPAAPTGLTAAPGNAQVVLGWTAISGATGYYVKRGTATGGPYTQISTPTTASYTDAGLSNGTKYFYVVSAYDSAGQSANSAEASATPVLASPPVPTG